MFALELMELNKLWKIKCEMISKVIPLYHLMQRKPIIKKWVKNKLRQQHQTFYIGNVQHVIMISYFFFAKDHHGPSINDYR
jgi:hypothetical protein